MKFWKVKRKGQGKCGAQTGTKTETVEALTKNLRLWESLGSNY